MKVDRKKYLEYVFRFMLAAAKMIHYKASIYGKDWTQRNAKKSVINLFYGSMPTDMFNQLFLLPMYKKK